MTKLFFFQKCRKYESMTSVDCEALTSTMPHVTHAHYMCQTLLAFFIVLLILL